MRTNTTLSIVLAAVLPAAASLFTSCSDLRTDLPVASTGELKIHDTGWVDTVAANFHGKVLAQAGFKLDECVSCHSTQYTGGVSGVSCYQCHQLYPHPANFASVSGHPQFLYAQNYPLSQCKTCHGNTYAGEGDSRLSCMNSGCHVDATNTPKSPEACNTCHGTFSAPADNLVSAAPPKSVTGDTQSSSRGVGAHQAHVVAGSVGKAVKCQECHTVPTQVFSPGHLGTLPAEVVFNDTLARLKTGSGTNVPNPVYTPTTLKCSNTYCHGNWTLRKATSSSQFVYTDSVMAGNNATPSWVGGSAEVACGSCHGIPPKGHLSVALSTCGSCHDGVVTTDGKILDTKKHMNGKINVFGQEYSF